MQSETFINDNKGNSTTVSPMMTMIMNMSMSEQKGEHLLCRLLEMTSILLLAKKIKTKHDCYSEINMLEH